MLLIVAATKRELLAASELNDVELLVCGVGPIEAAISVASRLCVKPHPTVILHVGVAGARRHAKLAPGTLIIGTASYYCDTSSKLVADVANPDKNLLTHLLAALPDALALPIGTSADIGGSDSCDVEAMEGFSVLRAANIAGIAAIELRVISNEIEEQDRANWHLATAFSKLDQALPVLAAKTTSYCDVLT